MVDAVEISEASNAPIMTPLDLTSAPPRAPHAELRGITFLPRSIDKARASLPGGDLGEYAISGFTAMMLEECAISLHDFIATVRDAATEDDVAAFVEAHAKPGGIATWNAFIRERIVAGGDRAVAQKRFPWLHERPDLELALDVLAEDDRRSFA